MDQIAADPIYLDVSVPPGKRKTLPVETTRHAFAYVFAGAGKFCNASGPLAVPTEAVGWLDTTPPAEADNRSLVLFDRGDEVVVQAGEDGIRFLLVSGKPLEEPVAWYGPIVMNTQEQLRQAFEELREGTFLKSERKDKGKAPKDERHPSAIPELVYPEVSGTSSRPKRSGVEGSCVFPLSSRSQATQKIPRLAT